MAIIPAGVLSHPSGKIGKVVGATWKSINYFRAYVIPANPNTAAQQAQRTWFLIVARLAKAFLGDVCQPYWDPFVRKNSGYAAFIGRQLTAMNDLTDFANVVMADGSLEGALITNATYAGANVTITWDQTVLGNGSLTDDAIACVYDVQNQVGFSSNTATRDDETVNVPVGTGRIAGNLKAYLFFTDDKTAPTKVARSDYHQVGV